MRQYAREHLEAGGKADEWRRRHAEHYARVAEDVETKVIGAGEVAGRRRVLLEVDNLRAAVMWALARDDDGDQSLALRIIAGLAPLTGVDRTIGIGSWAARATEIVMTAPARLRGIVLAVAAWSAFERNEIDASRIWSEQALGHLAELPDVGVTLAYAARAGMASNLGLRRDAVALLDEGRAALHGINRAELQWGTATLQTMAAIFASLDDDRERARSSIDAALSEARALGSPSTLAVSLFALGFVLRDSDPRAALAALEESIELMRAGAFQAVLANALLVVAQIRVEAGDRAAALEALRDALQVSLEMGGVSRTTPLVHECFVTLAGSALEAAGVLWGVVTEGGAFGYVQAMLNDRDRARQDDAIRALSVLGPERLEAVSARGAAMSAEAAINFALVEIQRVTQSAQK
jgi:tetratricopeptide (TPR) repeat protein